MDKLSNKEVIKKIKSFLKKVNKKFKLDKVILFGSRARGDWLYSSDIDLILVSDDFKNINFLERIRIVSRMWDHLIGIQPICYTNDEFNRKKKEIGIVQQALKEGKEVAVT